LAGQGSQIAPLPSRQLKIAAKNNSTATKTLDIDETK